MKGHFAKANTTPKKKLVEFRDFNAAPKSLGDAVALTDVFNEGDKVSAVVTKGKGFQGVVKRHGFGGVGQATHGQHNRLRAPGSIGASSFPSKVFKGMRMAGQRWRQQESEKPVDCKNIADQNLLLVRGAVPATRMYGCN